MPSFRPVDASVLLKPVKAAPRGRRLDPEVAQTVRWVATITDASVAYEVSLEPGEKAAAVRGK